MSWLAVQVCDNLIVKYYIIVVVIGTISKHIKNVIVVIGG